MRFLDVLKKAWEDAKDPTHSSLNDYDEEKGYKQWNIFIPKDELLEKQSFQTLSKVYGCGLKKILVDILIPSWNGHTNQIDLVFINRSGIYVIEVKNFACMLEGNNTDNWVRTEFNGKKNKIHNPIKQNLNHIKSLRKILPYYPSSYFKNIILLADTCACQYVANTDLDYDTLIVNYKDLKAAIKELTKSSEIVFSEENIYRIYDELSKYARYSYEQRMKHLEYVESLKGVN